MADTKKVSRKPAPKVSVKRRYQSERATILNDLDSKQKKFKHQWDNRNITQEELEAKGLEIVKKDGKPIVHRNSVVVRRPMEDYVAQRKFNADHSLKSARRMVKHGNITMTAKAKKPINNTE